MASGDRFITCAQVSRALREPLLAAGHDVLAVEMEGAAVAQVCRTTLYPLPPCAPFSDRADDDAHVDFPVFIQNVASRYADHIVRHLIAMAESAVSALFIALVPFFTSTSRACGNTTWGPARWRHHQRQRKRIAPFLAQLGHELKFMP
jgi:hypothetical protein